MGGIDPLQTFVSTDRMSQIDVERTYRTVALDASVVQVFGRRRCRASPRSRRAGVQKAPGREVAGSWAAAGRRALWGFEVSGAFAGGATLGRRDLHACSRRRAGKWKRRPGRGLKGIDGRRAH
jgi:hypothetical protein